ncbi:MAG: exosortase U [Planctomycetales bacterium]|nr:exosortase U [Planctomycetales bacterium]
MESHRSNTIAAVTFWVSVFLAPMPGFAVYLSWLGEHDQYGYVLPLLIAVIALVLFRWDFQLRLPTSLRSLLILGGAIFVLLFAAYRTSPWLTAIAFVLVATGWLHTHFSSGSHHRMTYLALPLVMLVRLPLNLDLTFSSMLQRFTSQVSSYLLDAFGVAHYLRGNVIELPGGTLFVEEACSGVQSLFTLMFLVCLWIVFRRRPLISTPVYIMAAVVWAMVMNVIRITAIALAQEWYSYNLAEGIAHSTLGWVCLIIATLLTLSTDRILRVAFYPVPPNESGHEGNPVVRLWNRLLLFGVDESDLGEDEYATNDSQEPVFVSSTFATTLVSISLSLCLLCLGLGYHVVQSRFGSVAVDVNRRILWEPDKDLLQSTPFASFVTDHQMLREANSRQLGNHADVWTVIIDGMPVRLAVSQPYPEWHDMRACYVGNGWQINDWIAVWTTSRENSDAEGDDRLEHPNVEQQWPISYLEMVRDTRGFGTLLFCGITRDGELLSPPMSGLGALLDARVQDRSILSSNVIMLQLWTESEMPLVPDQIAKLHSLFTSFRQSVHDALSTESGLKPPRTELTGGQIISQRHRR